MLIVTLPITMNVHHLPDLSTLEHVDALEFRLDYFIGALNIEQIALLRRASPVPVIFTLRCPRQGGHYPHSTAQRLRDMTLLCALNPDYVDLEYDVPHDVMVELHERFPEIQWIISYHNFQETPIDLLAIMQAIQHPLVHRYKMVTQANSTLDALRMLQFVWSCTPTYTLMGFCMGEEGQCTRILCPLFGSFGTYACLDSDLATAPGQLTVHDMVNIYHVHQLNCKTKIYALLGDPVHRSLGHRLHNQAMRSLGQNAVYIKLRIRANELAPVLHVCRALPFEGFSITMPWKETVIPLLDAIEPSSQAIAAINTVVKRDERLIGLNTDGLGTMQALEKFVVIEQQTILILGAGGAARAVAYEAVKRGAQVIIMNRSLEKAKTLAHALNAPAYELHQFPNMQALAYTVIINTLPEPVFLEQKIHDIFAPSSFLPHIVAMDLVYQPLETLFLKQALRAGCHCIGGDKLFINQALLQMKTWFGQAISRREAYAVTFGESNAD